jgi:hypothetical protein
MRNSLFLAACICVLFHVSQSQAYSPPDPQPAKIRQLIIAGDFAGAIKVCDYLIGYYRDLGTQPTQDVIAANYTFSMGYYLLARAQIFALQGHFDRAAQSLAEAESSVTLRGGSDPGIFDEPWSGLVEITRGLIQEKKGNIKSARAAYRQSKSSHGYARLALLDLEQGLVTDAKSWAARDPDSPTSVFVLGKIAANAGDQTGANRLFRDACRRLQSAEDGKSDANEFMPIFFCEARGIRSACKIAQSNQ